MLKALDSKRTTIFLLVILFLVLLFGYSLARLTVLAQTSQTNQTNDEINSSNYRIVYLVPSDVEQVEKELSPTALLENDTLLEEYHFSIQSTSDWNSIKDLLSSDNLDVLVVHHNAINLVNPDEIKTAINQGVIVAGIGIPGLELAELAGEPALFTSTWSADEGYTTTYYFYIYSYSIQGDQTEIDRLLESGWQPGTNSPPDITVENTISVNYHASTDTLLGKDFSILFSLIHTHLLDINGSDTVPTNNN